MELCTVFDSKYLTFGLTMYRSLLKNGDTDKVLNILCIDDKVYQDLKSMNLTNICLYSLEKLENDSDDIKKLRDNKTVSNYGNIYSQFCWALTPFFCYWLLHNKSIESLLYVDSDIYFYQSVDIVNREVENYSIGIITHRHPHFLNNNTDVGKYNVGIVYFRNDEIGRSCSSFWKELMINVDNEWVNEYGSCGDQKYLELFEKQFTNVCVIDKLVGHAAPWCFDAHEYIDKYTIKYKDNIQKLVFIHFSHFNIVENGWKSSYNGEWCPEEKHELVIEYYEDYYKEMMETKKIFNL